jgi:hypothetical protein
MRHPSTLAFAATLCLLMLPVVAKGDLFTGKGWAALTATNRVETASSSRVLIPGMKVRTRVGSGGLIVVFCGEVIIDNVPGHSESLVSLPKLLVSARLDKAWLAPGVITLAKGHYVGQGAIDQITHETHCAQWVSYVDAGRHLVRVYWHKFGGYDDIPVQLEKRTLTVIAPPSQ